VVVAIFLFVGQDYASAQHSGPAASS